MDIIQLPDSVKLVNKSAITAAAFNSQRASRLHYSHEFNQHFEADCSDIQKWKKKKYVRRRRVRTTITNQFNNPEIFVLLRKEVRSSTDARLLATHTYYTAFRLHCQGSVSQCPWHCSQAFAGCFPFRIILCRINITFIYIDLWVNKYPKVSAISPYEIQLHTHIHICIVICIR